MKISPKLKIGFAFLAVFAVGAICGCWAHAKVTEHIFVSFMNNQTWAPAMLKGLDKELHLTPEQQQKAKILLDDSVNEVTGSCRQIGQQLAQLHVRLQSILTLEQQAKNEKSFQDFRKELQEKYNICFPTADADATNSPALNKP